MTHLSASVLARAHQFLLTIYGAGGLLALRRMIPAGLSRLISCERVSFNEVDLTSSRPNIVTTPIPSYWGRLNQAFLAYMHENPLLNIRLKHPLHRSWLSSNPDWKKAALYHEYYRPAGVRHIFGTVVAHDHAARACIGINREHRRDFSQRDMALLELLSPHIATAWRNALRLEGLRKKCSASKTLAADDQYAIVVDLAKRSLVCLSHGAATIVQKYFERGPGGSPPLPDTLWRWLLAQRKRFQSIDRAADPLAALTVPGEAGNLSVRILQMQPESAVLLLEEAVEKPVPVRARLENLTARESEILHWVGEGKRNAEIALIVDAGERTVEKHLEHIFLKLGVETRTAAVHHALRIRRE